MISTKQILTIGMLAALAVAASTMTFGTVFAQDDNSGGNQDNDQTCTGSDCTNNQLNQNNREGDNTVGDVSFG